MAHDVSSTIHGMPCTLPVVANKCYPDVSCLRPADVAKEAAQWDRVRQTKAAPEIPYAGAAM
jgi:hypothetical protein